MVAKFFFLFLFPVSFTICCLLPAYAELVLPDPGNDQPVAVTTNNAEGDEPLPPKNEPLKLRFELTDGTRVIGVPAIETLPFKTSFADIKLSLKLIDSIEFSKETESARVLFGNGDKLEGSLKVEEIGIETVFGRHSIPMKHVVSMGVVTGGAAGAIIQKGLVLYYSFDGNEGGRVTDRSGKGNHGKVEGAKWVAGGKKGGAFRFAGGTQRIEVKNNPAFSLKQEDNKTFSLWWKREGNVEHKILLGKYTGGDAGTGFLLLTLPSEMCYYIPSRLHHYGKFRASFFMDEWNHLVAVKEGVDWKIYQNGVARQLNSSRNWPLTFDLTTDIPLGIGGTSEPSSSKYGFEGLIDEVMIFDRALSAEEIKKLYEKQK